MIFVNDIKRLAATNSQTAHYEHQLTQQHCSFVQLKVFAQLLHVVANILFKRIGLLLSCTIVLVSVGEVLIGYIGPEHPCLPFVAVLMTHAYMLQQVSELGEQQYGVSQRSLNSLPLIMLRLVTIVSWISTRHLGAGYMAAQKILVLHNHPASLPIVRHSWFSHLSYKVLVYTWCAPHLINLNYTYSIALIDLVVNLFVEMICERSEPQPRSHLGSVQ